MSESKAKKKRKAMLKTFGHDVTSRRTTISFSTHERITKTKKETTDKQFKKHKKHFHDDDE